MASARATIVCLSVWLVLSVFPDPARAQSSSVDSSVLVPTAVTQAGEREWTRHVVNFGAGSLGALFLSVLCVNSGPNWDDADENLREDMGWYVGAPIGATLGVWIEGERTGDVAPWAPVVGSLLGLALGAAHASATEGESSTSYAALLLLPPLGATILNAVFEPEGEEP
jgi:peptidoglycan/LPS O-acetylase OafA/YrhL